MYHHLVTSTLFGRQWDNLWWRREGKKKKKGREEEAQNTILRLDILEIQGNMHLLSWSCKGVGEPSMHPVVAFSHHWVHGPHLHGCLKGLLYAVREFMKERRSSSTTCYEFRCGHTKMAVVQKCLLGICWAFSMKYLFLYLSIPFYESFVFVFWKLFH